MTDNITLPRGIGEYLMWVLEESPHHGDWSWNDCVALDALRTALAAEPTKQEPVESGDDEEFKREDVTTLLLEVMDWTYAQAHRNRPMSEAEQKVLDDIRTALAAEPTKQEPVAWIESPHGVIRANPNYRLDFPSQLLHWQIPLYTAPPDIEALRQEAGRLREALRDTTIHLGAAAELLKRGGEKAAASNKMFGQMLADYTNSFERGRAALRQENV